jgi:hypothetical protein
MAKRLNDTAPIAAMPKKGGMRQGESINIEIRPIDNGYIKRESKYMDNGEYTCKETFSPDRPTINNATSDGNMMKSAIDFMKK